MENNTCPNHCKDKQSPPCCPIDSEPKLAANYIPRGTTQHLDDLPVYTVGQGDKAIVVITDAFGPDGGRTKLICDQLANAGFFVVLVDVFKGNAWKSEEFTRFMDWFPNYMWDKIQDNFTRHVYPFLESKGVKSIGTVGFCYGVSLASISVRVVNLKLVSDSILPWINILNPINSLVSLLVALFC